MPGIHSLTCLTDTLWRVKARETNRDALGSRNYPLLEVNVQRAPRRDSGFGGTAPGKRAFLHFFGG